DLAEQEPTIRGLGPTTTAAIERFRRSGTVASPGRTTNGAAMRALPVGWVLPHDQAERRRQVTIAMSRATHADPAALVAACVSATRSEEHTSELQSLAYLVCRLLLEKKNRMIPETP